jgi:uncharacterized membrane protein YbhN (UPF0104 family)
MMRLALDGCDRRRSSIRRHVSEPQVASSTAALPARIELAPLGRRALRIAILLAGAVAVVWAIHAFGLADMEKWLDSLWTTLTEVHPLYVLAGIGLETGQTVLAALAWYWILRAAYPEAHVTVMPVVTCYAVGVAGNEVLPAHLGTLLMLVMLLAVVRGSTFAGLIGGQVAHKLPFTAAGLLVYVFLFATVSGSFSTELGALERHRALTAGIVAAAILVVAVLCRVFWSRLDGAWKRAKRGAVILGDPPAYALRVVLPCFGAWFCKLGVIAVFLAAYGLPVSIKTIMTVAGGNSLAHLASVTPGGAGVNQAVNSAALTLEGVPTETALAYSTGQQLVTTVWNVLLAICLVAFVFGWRGGMKLLSSSYDDARTRARDMRAQHAA